MRMCSWLVAVMALFLVFCADMASAKGKKAGGKKGKGRQEAPATTLGVQTITGTVKADGENVKLIAEDKTEYTLGISLALVNKEKNDQKVTVTGEVSEIAGRKWLSAVSSKEDKLDKPAGGTVNK